MLNVSALCASYGAIEAVREVDLNISPGSLVALLGSNGAGKSTLLNCIAGIHKPRSGKVTLKGDNVTGLTAFRAVRRGICLVPEGRMVVAPLSVEDNLHLSSYANRGDFDKNLERIYDYFPRLAERRKQLSGSLSGGEQQMLAMGRALMTDPTVLLLDEPSMGLAPIVVDTVYEAIVTIHNAGQSILLVEQNAALALPVCDYAYILRRGNIAAEGVPADLRDSPEIQDAYLG